MSNAARDFSIERFRSDPEYRKRVNQRMGPRLLKHLLQSWVANGYIDPKGKSELQILAEVRRILDSKEARLVFAIDHTSALREVAAEMGNAGKTQIQLLLLATWIEHIINDMVSIAAHRRGLSADDEKQMIRDTPLTSKMTWLLPLLGYRRMLQRHVAQLRRISELRNQFVHYKWNYSPDGHSGDVADALETCEASFQYLAAYRARETLGGSKGLLKTQFRTPKSKAK